MLYKKYLLWAAAILSLGLIVICLMTSSGGFDAVDYQTTWYLQSHLSDAFNLPFSIISLLGSAEFTFLIWLIIFCWLYAKKLYLQALVLGLFFVSILFELVSKILIIHPGPPHYLYKGVTLFNFPSQYVSQALDYSFPSGHLTRTTFLLIVITFLVLPKLQKGQRLVWILFIDFVWIVMFVSRIYLGAHWLSDVLGGSLLGGLLGIIWLKTMPLPKVTK